MSIFMVKMPGEAITAAEAEQVRRNADTCALCEGASSDFDGGVLIVKSEPAFPFKLVAMLCSRCIANVTDETVAALRAKARVDPGQLSG